MAEKQAEAARLLGPEAGIDFDLVGTGPERAACDAAIALLGAPSDEHLELDRPRDWAIAALIPLVRPLALKSERYSSLLGGNALRQCLKRGLVRYLPADQIEVVATVRRDHEAVLVIVETGELAAVRFLRQHFEAEDAGSKATPRRDVADPESQITELRR